MDDEHIHLPMFVERPPRPRVRADCEAGGVNDFRPCPWLGCKYNIREAPIGKPTCVLDVALEGGVTLEEVGEMIGLTRERIRQIEQNALRKIKIRDKNVYNDMLRKALQEN
jgi:hypothetical protein